MQDKSSLLESIELLELSFETLRDAIAICDYPLRQDLKNVAMRSRVLSALMLSQAIERVIGALCREGLMCLE